MSAPDALVLDVRVEQGGGLELLREVKRGRGGPSVIVFSRQIGAEDRRQAIAAGADILLDDDTPLEELEEALRHLVREHAMRLRIFLRGTAPQEEELHRQLQTAGYHVEFVDDGDLADLIVAEAQTVGSGLRSLRHAQRVAPGIPTVLLTNELCEREMAILDGAGAAACVSACDVTAGRLATHVTRAISRQPSEAQPAGLTEAILAQLATRLDELFWISDPARTSFEYISPAFERIFGRTREELRRHPELWQSSVHPDDRVQAGARGVCYDKEIRIVRPDGSVRWLRERTFPLDSGAVLGVGSDVTALHQLERRLETAEKTSFLGGLTAAAAHAFSNLLTVMSSSVRALEDEALSSEERRAELADMRATCERGVRITRKLLGFGRKRAGAAWTPLDLGATIPDTLRGMKRVLGGRIDVRVEIPHDLPAVRGRASDLEEAFTNLVCNAADAMPTGGTLTVSGRNKDDGFVEITVADTGCGMDEATRARVFEPFFTTKGSRGTGLGLPIVRAVVNEQGGDIDVDSAPGRGTTFTVRLPVAEQCAP